MHSADEKLLRTANLYIKLFDGSDPIEIPNVDRYFDHIDICDYLPNFNIKVIFTPGHTWGSICLLIDDCLFTGDTLLYGKIGRTDLPGGDKRTLIKSLIVLSKIPNQTNIYPGHGIPSTIGYELEFNNSFIKALEWA